MMKTSEFWTRAQVDRLRALYHSHTNDEIAEIMGITGMEVGQMVFKLGLVRGVHNWRKIILTREQIEWLRANYANTTNAEIMGHLKIRHAKLHELARAYGLTKSNEFMLKVAKENFRLASIAAARLGWPPKGYTIPNSHRFKKGVTNLMRLGPEKEAERIRRSRESRNATIASERLRIKWGLEQRTKMKLNGFFPAKINVRYQMRKLGYIVERGGQTATITPQTRRSEHYEKRCSELGITLIQRTV